LRICAEACHLPAIVEATEPFAKGRRFRDNARVRGRSWPSSLAPMSRNEPEVAVFFVDITGSTPLYEAIGDTAAARQVGACLEGLQAIIAREGGSFILSRGDDVLCTFADVSAALRAAHEMLARPAAGQLSIHGGLHVGSVVHAHGDIFGDAVNVTARLLALARPGEILASQSFVDRVPAAERSSLRVLDHMTFKGKSEPTEIYSLVPENATDRTEVVFGRGSGHTRTRYQQVVPEVSVMLRYTDSARSCKEQASLSIGRSPDCDLVIDRSWVSRQHALVTVRRGKVQLEDRSSSGTYVSPRGGYEFFMRRETVLLTGAGTISPARRPTDANAEVIHYEVVRRRRAKPQ
jgi:adenylate cyclase